HQFTDESLCLRVRTSLISRLSPLFRSRSHQRRNQMPRCFPCSQRLEVVAMRYRERCVSLVFKLRAILVLYTFHHFSNIGTSRAVDLLRFPLAHRWQYTARSSANLSQMQQQGQSAHGQVQSSSQTQLAAVSTPVILPLLILAVTTAPVAASAQPQLVPLRIRFVLFLCCASPHMQVNIAACGQSFNLG
ncbi:hypothetical protein P692DRAFT_20885313, partial [Suillus brevipes Sb2]